MVNEPSFNPNMPVRYSLEQRLNKCIGYTYEPGSTFKIITSACALQEHIKKENDTIDGNQGVYEVFNETIKDEKKYGKLSFTEALCYSSNVCFAKIANEIGNERLYKYTRDFGLGDRTGIELPGEENGIVHPIEKWSGRTRVTVAIGQEVLVTPLQMVMMFAAVANNGILCQPRICDRILSSDGAIVDSSVFKPVRRVISADVAARLKKMMCAVVEKGTGVRATVPGLAICGKTGTAQKIDKESGAYSNTRGWSSFIGFTPPENPQLLCAVIIDEPLRGEMGGAAAAPAFSKIVSQLIAHPQLEYAERMLPHSRQPAVASVKQDSGLQVPQICGMKAVAATTFLAQENIPYEISGIGSTIEYQSPSAGNLLYAGTKLLLYTNSPDSAQKKEYGLVMPQCRGKDLRDAVNSVNMRGLVPFIVGAGTVRRQWPEYGTLMKQAEACTLICSFSN
jgi:membrane peptidoglycan carboxypeptidase